MKSRVIIAIMTLIWLVLMANIIWQETDGQWQVEDEEKIGRLEVAQYTNQVIVVAVDQEKAWLSLFERETTKNDESKWRLILETEAVIGKNGLGKRKEGDGKTPVGIFRFVNAFGILENPGSKLDYIKIDESHYWVDDSNSKYYNQLVSTKEVVKDWETAEHICEYGESYRYVLATSYNLQAIPGAGSAVFLHCTSSSNKTTQGCIAIPENHMREILKRMESDCVLIIDDVKNILSY